MKISFASRISKRPRSHPELPRILSAVRSKVSGMHPLNSEQSGGNARTVVGPGSTRRRAPRVESLFVPPAVTHPPGPMRRVALSGGVLTLERIVQYSISYRYMVFSNFSGWSLSSVKHFTCTHAMYWVF